MNESLRKYMAERILKDGESAYPFCYGYLSHAVLHADTLEQAQAAAKDVAAVLDEVNASGAAQWTHI